MNDTDPSQTPVPVQHAVKVALLAVTVTLHALILWWLFSRAAQSTRDLIASLRSDPAWRHAPPALWILLGLSAVMQIVMVVLAVQRFKRDRKAPFLQRLKGGVVIALLLNAPSFFATLVGLLLSQAGAL